MRPNGWGAPGYGATAQGKLCVSAVSRRSQSRGCGASSEGCPLVTGKRGVTGPPRSADELSWKAITEFRGAASKGACRHMNTSSTLSSLVLAAVTLLRPSKCHSLLNKTTMHVAGSVNLACYPHRRGILCIGQPGQQNVTVPLLTVVTPQQYLQESPISQRQRFLHDCIVVQLAATSPRGSEPREILLTAP